MTSNSKPRRRLSLRVLLLLILAAALSPVLVIGGIRWSGDIEREAQYRRETMTLVAQLAASRADTLLRSAPALLDLLRTSSGERGCGLSMQEIADALPDFSTFGVVDAAGKVQCTTVPQGKGNDVSDREWFRRVRDGGKPFVQTGAMFSTVTQRWLVASALRRDGADGQFVGAMVLGTPIDSLVAELEHSSLPQSYEIALLDSSGRVFASGSFDMMDAAVQSRLAANGRGFFEIQPQKGDLRQAAIVPLVGGDFYAMVSAPKPTPIALENLAAFGNFALPLLGWLLALITAWLAMDRLVLRWLDYLRRIAGLYASGKLSVQPLRAKRQAPGEINELADTMQEMAIRIRDRTGRLETALATRDAAMKEIHHRVRNNLQIINSLLSLQGRRLKDPAATAVLDDARVRINALSLVHASLYEHNNISSVSTRAFFIQLTANLSQALGAEDMGIRVTSDIEDEEIPADVAVPLALFAAEAVTNSIKHAFPEPVPPHARIQMIYSFNEETATLTVEDNGVGYDPASTKGSTGVGSTLKAAFAKQVRGTLEHATPAGGGRIVRIVMPRTAAQDVEKLELL